MQVLLAARYQNGRGNTRLLCNILNLHIPKSATFFNHLISSLGEDMNPFLDPYSCHGLVYRVNTTPPLAGLSPQGSMAWILLG